MQLQNVRTRAMTADDVDAVIEIEASVYEFPWSVGIFCDCLRVGYQCRVLLLDEKIIGYAVLSTLAQEAHVLNICVDTQFQQAGFGRQLLNHLFHICADRGIYEVFLEVRPSNVAALRMYRRFGFEQIGVRQNYYRAGDGREDALVLCADLNRIRHADFPDESFSNALH